MVAGLTFVVLATICRLSSDRDRSLVLHPEMMPLHYSGHYNTPTDCWSTKKAHGRCKNGSICLLHAFYLSVDA